MIGWFQGRTEFGPRALGARSILASPIDPRDAGAAQRDQGSRGLPPGRAGRDGRGHAATGSSADARGRAVHAVRLRRARRARQSASRRRATSTAPRACRPSIARSIRAYYDLLRRVQRTHRRAGARQHVVQHARRADGEHAARRARIVLDLAARCARDRLASSSRRRERAHERMPRPASVTAMRARGAAQPTPQRQLRAPLVSWSCRPIAGPRCSPLPRRAGRAALRSGALRDHRRATTAPTTPTRGVRRSAWRRRSRARPDDPLCAGHARRPGPGRRAQRRLARRARAAHRLHRRRHDARSATGSRTASAALRAMARVPAARLPAASSCRCRSVPTDYELDDARPRARRVRDRQRVRAAQRARSRSAASTSASRRAWREDSDLQFALLRRGRGSCRASDAVVLHPVRPARWGVSLRSRRRASSTRCSTRSIRALYRERIRARAAAGTTTRSSALRSPALVVRRRRRVGVGGDRRGRSRWSLLTAASACRRLRRTAHAPAHVAEMVVHVGRDSVPVDLLAAARRDPLPGALL